ncbi:MAG: AMP-binding protein, partial [Clostridia bacterium]
MDIPRSYNAATDLIGRNLAAGRGGKAAFIDDAGQVTYDELAARVDRFGSGLLQLGLEMESRILVAMVDTIDWPVAFLGAIKAGIVPIAVNTLLTTKDYEYMLSDSRARALLVSEQLLPQFAPILEKCPFLKHVIVSGKNAHGKIPFDEILKKGRTGLAPAPTTRDDACFWLYSSGSTGMPKGTVHVHSSMALTAELYAQGVLGMKET